jgi:hypothetical protein
MSRAVQRLRQQFPQRGATPSSRPYGRYATTSTPDELASCYLHALTAAGNLTSKTAIQRIVKVTRTGLRSHKWALARYRWPAPSGVVTSAA